MGSVDTGLNDEPARDDERKAYPGGHWNGFVKNDGSGQHAHQCKESDVDSEHLRKIPPNDVDHQSITPQCYKAQENHKNPLSSQTFPDESVPADFEDCRPYEYGPGYSVHELKYAK